MFVFPRVFSLLQQKSEKQKILWINFLKTI